MVLVLGVDGGGSKTRAVIAGEDGVALGVGQAGSSNYHAVGIERAVAAVVDATCAAASAAGVDLAARPSPIAAGCFGLAGVDRPIEQEEMRRRLDERGLAARVAVVTDVELVLAAAGEPWGVALIGGTGSVAYGLAPDRRVARAGGWGALIGDEGSGYNLAIQALRLATQTADGRAYAPAILRAVLDHFGLDEPEQLLGAIYRPGLSISEISAVAAKILPLADAGDPATVGLVDRAARSLAALVDAVATTLDASLPDGGVPLAMTGGLLVKNPGLRASVLRHIATPLARHAVVADPAAGAVVLGTRSLA